MADPTPEVIRTLIERLEQGSGPDRHLDAEISAQFNSERPKVIIGIQVIGGDYRYDLDCDWSCFYESERFTASIDAAVALTEKLLPEIEEIGFQITKGSTNAYVCADTFRQIIKVDRFIGCAKTTPRAILSATLHALLQRLETGGGDG